MLRTHHFKIAGRTFSAVFNLNVLDRLADMAGPMEDGTPLDAQALMQVWSTRYGLLKALLVLIREGERLEGRELEIDEDWLRERLSPAEMMWIQRKMAAVMIEAMRMETAADEDEEVDAVLEEIKKKVVTGDSLQDSSDPGE